MGRTIPSWRMVVEAEMAKLKKFQDKLTVDEQIAFHDMLLECKLYAPYAGNMASPVKELPFLISMLFGQHKRILDLEKKIVTLETVLKKDMLKSPSRERPDTPRENPVSSDTLQTDSTDTESPYPKIF